MKKTLIIASENLGKFYEFKDFFLDLPLDLVSLRDKQFANYTAPKEEGSSFEKNAIQKALSAAKALNNWAIGDDSGLVVPMLKEKSPGMRSARYAGDQATDKENRTLLLNNMKHLNGDNRFAYFECSIALASPEKVVFSTTQRVEGFISENERGRNGFGYDSLFIKHGYNKTFAEVDQFVKNSISHRKKVISLLVPILQEHLGLVHDLSH